MKTKDGWARRTARVRARALAVGAVAALAAVAGGTPAAAQEYGERLDRAFSGETRLALEREVRAAEEAGIPSRPLVLKALEGHSKGADDARVLAAVAGLRDRLGHAAAIVGGDASEDLLVATAGALFTGVDPGVLGDVRDRTRPDVLAAAYVVLADLVRRGVPPLRAGRAILSLGEAGIDAAAFDDFRRQVDADIRTGLAPERAAEIRVRGVLTRLGRGGGGGWGG